MNRLNRCLFSALVWMTVGGAIACAQISVEQHAEQGGSIVFRATTPPAGARLQLFRLDPKTTKEQTVFAQTSTREGDLELRPVYPLSPGETYEVRLSVGGKVAETLPYRAPRPNLSAPEIIEVYPTSQQVPANLLKFYIEFNQPMREGREIFDRIHLVDDQGKRVHSPWRRLQLWSNDSRRFSLWIHPGRIKQGVNLRAELGPVLQPDTSYRLVIDKSLQTPAGTTLATSFERSFRTTEEVRQPIDLSKWRVTGPEQADGILSIVSDRALDPFLFRRHVSIYRDNKAVPMDFSWNRALDTFVGKPESPWQPGTYEIRPGHLLEDLAGNTPVRAFDTDLEQPAPSPGPKSFHFVVHPKTEKP